MGVLNLLFIKLFSRRCHSNRISSVGIGFKDQEGEERFGSENGKRGDEGPSKCYVRKWEEIVKATGNFSVLIGLGGFGNVYKGRLKWGRSSQKVAVKVVDCSTGRQRLALGQELEVLLQLRHENVVKILGYCIDREEEGALIFEYVSNGTIEDKLHPERSSCENRRRHCSSKILSWKNRVKITFQLAQAIEYLHRNSIVHGDIKPSNVLLDADLNCKLCDFGSAKKMGMPNRSSMSNCKNRNNRIMGSPGYADPDYVRTGMASEKNDVYGFGMVLLELVTGLEPFGINRNVLDSRSSEDIDIVDPRLRGAFDIEEAKCLVKVARQCLQDSAVVRPSVACIREIMSESIGPLNK
ncbi:hypothetical protein MLD38_019129 [Melastoma candidum]|uniref:Uncharacterized protein n=1 Tax=Melastoma candidum TaxID=119954 RepID=A0ACB9R497_9MYRT|nr:hypothetical protein MLD38_019129 [Melastoma candidum]